MASHAQPSTYVPPTALDLVSVSKRELSFSTTTTPPPNDTIVITNLSPGELMYKIKTTKPLRYTASPHQGVLPRRASQTITISMQTGADALSPGKSRDRLQLCVMQVVGKADIDKLRRTDASVVHVYLPIRFVDDAGDAGTEVVVGRGDSVVTRPREAPPDVRPDVMAAAVEQDSGWYMAGAKALKNGKGDVDRLLMDGKYEIAVRSAAELQTILDERSLTLARLRAELSEMRAESAKVLKQRPDMPLAAEKLLSDPCGGVSADGIDSLD